MNKQKLGAEFLLFMSDEYVKRTYPEIFKLLTQKLKEKK